MKKPHKSAQPVNTPKIYTVEITPGATRQFQKLPPAIAQQMAPALRALASDPRPQGYKKLVGRPGFRIRVGNYRAIYLITDKILLIEVTEIGHRREVYG